MNSPRVSVIIPTYNRAPMLREALESVRRQNLKEVEIIVVDSESTDETAQVVREFQPGVKYLLQKRLGVSAARNYGIEQATAPYIAFLDSDDLWIVPEKLERQISFLEKNPDVGLVYARLWSYHVDHPADRRLDPCATPAVSFKQLLNGPNTVTTSTVVVRRSCFENVGVFNSDIQAAEDHELWLRIAKKYRIAFMEDAFSEYRRHHAGSINSDSPRMLDGYRRYFEIILREYRADLDAPRVAEQQLAKFEYLCGTTALKRGEPRKALALISAALKRDFRLGTQFIKEESSWTKKLWLPIKPYAALAASAIRSIA